MRKRAAIYCRVSTDVQRDNYSIPSQLRACIEYAEKKGYRVVGDWKVDPETGKDAREGVLAYVDDISSSEERRPALDAAFAFLAQQGFEVLIVHSVDRLARGPGLLEVYEAQFQQAGAEVEFVLGNYEHSAEGDVLKSIVATMARFENVKRVERTMRGKTEKVRRGVFLGKVPYGYRIDPEGIGGVCIEPTEAHVVRDIFARFNAGDSIRQIALDLTAQGVPSYSGREWAKSSLARILCNRWYVGEAIWNRHRRVRKRTVVRDASEWMKVGVPAILPPAVFEQAQRTLAHNRETRRREATRFYLLTGMVFCADCGRPYFAETTKAGRNRRLYDGRIYRHRKALGGCCNSQISGAILEGAAIEQFVRILLSPEELRRAWEEYRDTHAGRQRQDEAQLKMIETAEARVRQKRERLIDALEDGRIPREQIAERVRQREDELRDLEGQRREVAERLAAIPSESDYADIADYSRNFAEALRDTAALEDFRGMFWQLSARVEIKPAERTAVVRAWVPRGVSSQFPARCVRRQRPPPAPV